MSEWSVTTLADVVKLQRGHDLPTRDRRPGGVPIVGSFGITGRHDTAKVKGPGVTIGRSGSSFGTAVYVEDDYWPLNTCLYVTDFRGNDPRWVYSLLHEIDFSGYNSGSAQPSLNRNFLANIPVCRPPASEQQRIAGVLGALDDLIETNRQQISRLREVAQAYFESVARDGDAVTFGDVAQPVRQGVSRDRLSAGTPYLGLEHFGTDGSGIAGVGDAGTVESNKSRFTAGDVLYGKLRPYFRKYDRPGFDGVCSTEIWVLRGVEPYASAIVAALVAQPEFTEFAMQGSGGTRMPRADWRHVASMPVVVPLREQLHEVEPRLDALWRAGVDLQKEVTELTRARDELLPLLISGMVRVREMA